MEEDYEEIASIFTNPFVRWVKRSYPLMWEEILGLEREINRASMARNETEVGELFGKYKAFVRQLRDEFDSMKEREKEAVRQ